MPIPFAVADDVSDGWRVFSAAESTRADVLCGRASALLRQRLSTIDARVALFTSDPTSRAALDPEVVTDVVVTMVKRVMVNPEGAMNRSVGGDGYTATTSFIGSRFAQADAGLGELIVTDVDLKKLTPQGTKGVPASFAVKPALAPCGTPAALGVFVADGTVESGEIYGPYLS